MGGSDTPGTLENDRGVDVGMAPSPPSHRLGQGNGRPSPHREYGMRGPSNRAAGPETVSWRDLPRKDQLCVITLARLSEPLVQTSIQSYMFYQLKWFGPTLSDAVISGQAGILQYVVPSGSVCRPGVAPDRLRLARSASFTAAQFLTAMLWGRIADSGRVGRKTVLMIGLAGTCGC
ncbi:hypothetical protein CHGG_08704 [Chaetomium globosum CBS 148.51]|jgi:hypothetical protein|uniref:Major facilitator superfamily (MFS) profile domain-containing protein n=1 Tax=Chaetomium globosum (strain ATCC 6205 / CBS 148.51 / DSM 1962 / NBRC 6347 / NRRL 1970) TaxID=306901 RepID=Q2GTK0_CHAGB|nr:uncharacterized protein CHGG_08704 [Chaetomium globosum CBS 148.51]EAQ84690.1 hypothetical protein CHGG_08704 [Chaetomium globosum CBS 148.51]